MVLSSSLHLALHLPSHLLFLLLLCFYYLTHLPKTTTFSCLHVTTTLITAIIAAVTTTINTSVMAVVERAGENEAVKMIRVKEGLLKLGAAYCELAHKCLVIYSAHRDIAAQLPDVHDRDLHGVKYTGG